MSTSTATTSEDTLLLERRGATALVTMNRPAARNALDLDMRARFAECLQELRTDNSIKAVVLTGAGGHFCAGGDVKSIAEGQGGPRDVFEGRDRIRALHVWFDQLLDLEKPVIAAVDGVAFGAGLSLAMAADFTIASRRATFCAVFARLGFVPDLGGMYLLPRQVGLQRAKDLVFTARVVAAEEALSIGLVHSIAEGSVLDAALALAERFHDAPTGAIGMAKAVLNRSLESERDMVYAQEAMAQSLCRESSYHRDAVERFLSKQPARFNWK